MSRSPKPSNNDSIKYTTIFIMVLLVGLSDFILGGLIIGSIVCCSRSCCGKKSWHRKKVRKTRSCPNVVQNVIGEGDSASVELVVEGPTLDGGVAGAMPISLDSLRRATNDFDAANIIGKGGSAIVYQGVLDGVIMAVKRMSKQNDITIERNQFQSEFVALSKIRHRHLVGLLGYCLADNEKLLVLEYMENGSLQDRLRKWQQKGLHPLEWKERLRIALDVARGVEYLQSLTQDVFIHRDLKTSNIRLDDHLTAKVADFDLIRLIPEGESSIQTHVAGTHGYITPEIIATAGRKNTKVNVYSYGVVLMELITGRKSRDKTQSKDNQHLATWFIKKKLNKEKSILIPFIDPTIQPDEKIEAEIQIIAELAGQCV